MDVNRERLNEIEKQVRDYVLGDISTTENVKVRKNLTELIGEKHVRNLLDKMYNAYPFTDDDNRTFAFFILGYQMYSSLEQNEKLTKGGSRIIAESGGNPKFYTEEEMSLLLKLYENNKLFVNQIIEENKKDFTQVTFFDKVREFLFPS